MAKQPAQPRPNKPVPIPNNWGQMSAEEKKVWREKYQPQSVAARPLGAPKNYGSAPAPAPAPATASAPAGDQEQPGDQEQLGYQPGDQEQADQIGSDVAAGLSEEGARAFVGKILRTVADLFDPASSAE